MTDGKRSIVRQLLEEYEIGSTRDIQDVLKDLLDGTIKKMMESEMNEHPGYCKSERSGCGDYHDGYKIRQANSSYENMRVEVPQNRNSTSGPQVVRERQKGISDTDCKIISMCAEGMTTRQISETLEDICGLEASEGSISNVTDKLLLQIEDWQSRPLPNVCPVSYIDTAHYLVRDNDMVRKLMTYVVPGINLDGLKEVLTIEVGGNENVRYRLSVLNGLKNHGVKDILLFCVDELAEIKKMVATAFPEARYQRRIAHQVRNTSKYVSDKDRKLFTAGLKTTYRAPAEEKALEALKRDTKKWSEEYPSPMRNWHQNQDAIIPIFKSSTTVCKVIYTTNTTESLSATYRKLNHQRGVFPSDTTLLEALYLSTFEATKKWIMPVRNWGRAYGELNLMYEGRLPVQENPGPFEPDGDPPGLDICSIVRHM